MAAANNFQKFILCLTVGFFFCSVPLIHSQTNFLKKEITIQSEDQELGDILKDIEEKAGFTFSYNTAKIDEKRKTAINVEKASVAKAIDLIFNKSVDYKSIGQHVVLLPKNSQSKQTKTNDNQFLIQGTIEDASQGNAIKNATIYVIGRQKMVLSDSQGFYRVELDSKDKVKGLSFTKQGYRDTILMQTFSNKATININLHPVPELKPMTSNGKHLKLKNLHNRQLVKTLVPGKSKITGDNLTIYGRPKAQFSLLPFLGTNFMISSAVNNSVSLNLIAGYNGGVNGVEAGGILNIIRRDVKGIQLAGFSNFVGGNTRFLQLAGFFNKNGGNVTGVQAAGFSNVVLDTIKGVQAAGFQNTLHGKMHGLQISGFNNVTTRDVDGIQITGFANVAAKDVKMAQISGFFNYARNVKGLQLSGFCNIASDTLEEGQVATFVNYARYVNGLQNSGVFNMATHEVEGMQMAGFINYTKKLNGLQLGLFNYADTIENGTPVGLLSFVRKGFHRGELYANEAFGVNTAIKLGTRKFYNTLRFGHSSGDIQYAGYGIGTFIPITQKVALDANAASDFLISQSDYAGNIIQLSLGTDIKLTGRLALLIGPTLNYSIIKQEHYIPELSFVVDAFYSDQNDEKISEAWIGWHTGLAFEF